MSPTTRNVFRKAQNSNPSMLEGIKNIAEFMGKSVNTTTRWILHHGLPATKTPEGRWLTHKGLILQWIYAGHQAEMSSRLANAFEEDEIHRLAHKMDITPEQVMEIIDATSARNRSAAQSRRAARSLQKPK